MASFMKTGYGVENGVTGVVFAIAVAYILMGGLQRISKFTSSVVPAMSVLYFLLCMVIVFINFDKVPSVILSIFTEAITGKSIAGGALGYGVMHIIQTGVKRAAFSNEAGIGTAPMAHGNAKTSEPISEGYVAMLGPFIDTILVCTLTATVILVSIDKSVGDLNGINLTTHAFVTNLGEIGRHLLGIIIFLFSFSTMIGMANYNKKCWDFVFKGKMGFNNKTFILFYSMALAIAAIVEMNSIVNLIDICYALMAVPNIFGTVYLARKVKTALKTYNDKYHV
jgi:AGCS family alanine or glycine:cation symporter